MTKRNQFGIRSLLWAVLFSGIILAIVVAIQRPVQIRNQLKIDVEKLGGKMWIANNGSAISMNGTSITDSDIKDLAPLIRGCDLWVLDLSNTQITDESIPTLETLENRKLQINLDGTAVSDNGKLRVGFLRITREEPTRLLGFDPEDKPSAD